MAKAKKCGMDKDTLRLIKKFENVLKTILQLNKGLKEMKTELKYKEDGKKDGKSKKKPMKKK